MWLKRILLKFQYTKEESDMCRGELLGFMDTLWHECENKTIFEARCICSSNLEWLTNWPNLHNFGKKIILIPSSTTICERGFSKQNAIKSHLRNKLNLKTVDALMHVSLSGLEVDARDWTTNFNIWRNMCDQRILTLHWITKNARAMFFPEVGQGRQQFSVGFRNFSRGLPQPGSYTPESSRGGV